MGGEGKGKYEYADDTFIQSANNKSVLNTYCVQLLGAYN